MANLLTPLLPVDVIITGMCLVCNKQETNDAVPPLWNYFTQKQWAALVISPENKGKYLNCSQTYKNEMFRTMCNKKYIYFRIVWSLFLYSCIQTIFFIFFTSKIWLYDHNRSLFLHSQYHINSKSVPMYLKTFKLRNNNEQNVTQLSFNALTFKLRWKIRHMCPLDWKFGLLNKICKWNISDLKNHLAL